MQTLTQLPNYLQLPTFEGEIIDKDYRDCDCPMPYAYKKWHGALGRFTCIRLCCLAKAIEKITGQKFMEVKEYMPTWEWDCEEVIEGKKRECPPNYLLKRFRERGIKVKNHGTTANT